MRDYTRHNVRHRDASNIYIIYAFNVNIIVYAILSNI